MKLSTAVKATEDLSLDLFLGRCKEDPLCYASAAKRIMAAIGEPTVIDTQKDGRLGRIFSNRKIKKYAAFEEFFGIEETIEAVVGYFRHAAQGLEEKKQVLYLLGPVGSAKSSLAERIKRLGETLPVYALTHKGNLSPVFESPLGIIPEDDRDAIEQEYGIPLTAYPSCISPWASKRLEEDGDFTNFAVRKIWPSRIKQVCISRTEPSDDNNQDISSLVGKVDIRQLERFSQNDPDAYSYSGALNRGNRGVVEMVEIFKAPIKTLHPLLAATQEGMYLGTENIGAMPFDGVVLAHSNESEWMAFRNNAKNEAFLDRVCVVRVPYNLRVTEEEDIYKKLLRNSELSKAGCAPKTLNILSQFSVFSRVIEPENSAVKVKIDVYDGKDVREKNPEAKSLMEYKNVAGIDEGMSGMSTRFAFKILSKVFNTPDVEISANPVHLLMVLEDSVKSESLPEQREESYLAFIKGSLAPDYAEFLGKELQKAYLESYADYGQNLFDRYIQLADMWIQNLDYRDPQTGVLLDRNQLNSELESIEKAAGISNPRDFRNEVVSFVMRQKANGRVVTWESYEKLKEVIETKMFNGINDLLPVISFGAKTSSDEEEKHRDFLDRMKRDGYTESQVQLLVEWYIRFNRHH